MEPNDVTQCPFSRRGFLAGVSGAAAAIAVGGDAFAAAPSPHVVAADAPVLDLDLIQGNVLAGFGSDHQALVFVTFPTAAAGRSWLAALTPSVASTRQVLASAAGTPLLNVALTHAGLAALGRPANELRQFPNDFREGMRRRAEIIGDHGRNDARNWPEEYRSQVHAVVLVGAGTADKVADALATQMALLADNGVSIVYTQRGAVRADEPGHEHFGFRDGISQPGVRGFTTPQNPLDPNQGLPGQDLLWPGEFVLGYPGQPGVGGGEAAGPITRSGPEWTANGSYLVVRRLRQDVAAFRAFLADTAAQQGVTQDLAGARMVGRYKSGAPLSLTGEDSVDPGISDRALLADDRINNFEFHEDDPDGELVPLSAHIRKVYPRDEPTEDGGEEDTQTHRILRRGIPFGTSLPADAKATDAAATAAFPDDRGLLFMCYQSSIAQQFEFTQRRWANDPDFPQRGAGQDPIIGRMQSFVVTTGGDYFFQPSVAALRLLSSGSATATATTSSPTRPRPAPPAPPTRRRRRRP